MTIKNYYAGSNSSIGFYSLYQEIFGELKRLYILKGETCTGKSKFMRKIGLELMDKGFDLEYYHCPFNNQSIDGLIIPIISIGIVNSTAPHIVEPVYSDTEVIVLDFDQFRNDQFLEGKWERLTKLTIEIKENFESAYKAFHEAKQLHIKREEIYLPGMDFGKANHVVDLLKEKIFSGRCSNEKYQVFKKRFFGAITPNGAVNFIDNITNDIEKRYIIKGRPGSGKSTLMKKIANHAKGSGLSVEYYPCSFDPESLDMIIIPKLSVAILDGTAPHIVNPYKISDEVIDMFENCIDKSIEIENQSILNEINTDYKNKMVIGTNYLSEAKRLHDKLEEFYILAIDFSAIIQKRNEIISEFFRVNEYGK